MRDVLDIHIVWIVEYACSIFVFRFFSSTVEVDSLLTRNQWPRKVASDLYVVRATMAWLHARLAQGAAPISQLTVRTCQLPTAAAADSNPILQWHCFLWLIVFSRKLLIKLYRYVINSYYFWTHWLGHPVLLVSRKANLCYLGDYSKLTSLQSIPRYCSRKSQLTFLLPSKSYRSLTGGTSRANSKELNWSLPFLDLRPRRGVGGGRREELTRRSIYSWIRPDRTDGRTDRQTDTISIEPAFLVGLLNIKWDLCQIKKTWFTD